MSPRVPAASVTLGSDVRAPGLLRRWEPEHQRGRGCARLGPLRSRQRYTQLLRRRKAGPFWRVFSRACSESVGATASWPGEMGRPLALFHCPALCCCRRTWAHSGSRCVRRQPAPHWLQHKAFLRTPPATPSASSPNPLALSRVSQALWAGPCPRSQQLQSLKNNFLPLSLNHTVVQKQLKVPAFNHRAL